MFYDPSKGTAVERDSADLELLEDPNSSTGSPGAVAQDGGAAAETAAQGGDGAVAGAAAGAAAGRMKFHPWHLTNALLRMHVLACKVRKEEIRCFQDTRERRESGGNHGMVDEEFSAGRKLFCGVLQKAYRLKLVWFSRARHLRLDSFEICRAETG